MHRTLCLISFEEGLPVRGYLWLVVVSGAVVACAVAERSSTGTALIRSPSGGTITAHAPWKVTVMTVAGGGSCGSTFRIGTQRAAFGGASAGSEVEHAKSGGMRQPQ